MFTKSDSATAVHNGKSNQHRFNFISFISFLCCGIFLDFKISYSGIKKIAQRLKCLLCNTDKLFWTSGIHIKGEEEENIHH